MTSGAKTRGAHMRNERRALAKEFHARHQCLRHLTKIVSVLGLCDSKIHSNGCYDTIRDAIHFSREHLLKAEEWLGKAVTSKVDADRNARKQIIKEEEK